MSDSRDAEDRDEEEIDEDEILATLSPEELQELQSEMDVMIAPDESVPVGQRQKDQTEKPPTGTFDHRSLVDYLYWEKESKRMLEEERAPATLLPSQKTIREEAAKKETEENLEEVEYEVYEVIEEIIEDGVADCTDGVEIIEEIIEEIVEDDCWGEEEEEEAKLSARDKVGSPDEHAEPPHDPAEGATAAGEERPPDSQESTWNHEGPGRNSATQQLRPRDEVPETFPQREQVKVNKLKLPQLALSTMKMTSRPSGNETNLESTLDKVRNNNPSITEVNLNNIENIPKQMLLDYVGALKKNKHVKTFSIANTGADENAAFSLANMLRENRSITTLNIESNFVTGRGIVAIVRCLQFNETLTELRFHNQRHLLGHHAEMEISRLLKANHTLLKLGYHFEQPGPRMVVTNILTRNLDRQRQLRKEEQKQQQLKEQQELIQMYENSLNLPAGLFQLLGYAPPLELLQQHAIAPPSSQLNRPPPPPPPEPQRKLRHAPLPRQAGAEASNPLKDVQLKRTPKKRDPFLDLDPRDNRRPDGPNVQLRKTPKAKDAEAGGPSEDKPNLTDVIKTLKPIPRRRVPPKVDLTPRDQLLSDIKKSNVAYLKAVPLPKALESSEADLF